MGFNLSHFDLTAFVIDMAVLVIAITLHEFAHAITADRLGDPTPRRDGRISLLPPDHLEPAGTVMMVLSSLTGFGIGWGKPVMVDTRYFRHPARDNALVSLAGPVSNLLQATVFALIIRFVGVASPVMGAFLSAGVLINLSLAFFNLIPISPLDGSWILMAVLPRDMAATYYHWMQRYGALVFLGLVFFFPGVLMHIIGPPVNYVAQVLVGGI